MASEISVSSKLYELFASIFAKEPTVDFLRLLHDAENEALLKSYGVDCLSDIKHLPVEQQVETLALEYASLFLIPARSASPHESIQRGEGRLWGESTVQMDKIYKRFGFNLDAPFKDTPDHISAELSFLAKLIQLESEYNTRSLADARKGVLEAKKYFFKNHLLRWFPRFEDELVKAAKLCYYREIIKFLGVLLNEEWEGLRDV